MRWLRLTVCAVEYLVHSVYGWKRCDLIRPHPCSTQNFRHNMMPIVWRTFLQETMYEAEIHLSLLKCVNNFFYVCMCRTTGRSSCIYQQFGRVSRLKLVVGKNQCFAARPLLTDCRRHHGPNCQSIQKVRRIKRIKQKKRKENYNVLFSTSLLFAPCLLSKSW